MTASAIRVRGVSKRYRVFASERERLLHALFPRRRAGMQEVWALQDVDLDVGRGEAVAVIGRNGGGKSTLLQILTGTVVPTSGDVQVHGRVSALLELGSGFNPEYTGRDNVVMNGLLLGLAREDILRRFEEIVAFADIGDALDRPVKTYSSGMMMRLAFSVQVLTDPDILIVDEALSVGDFFFQQKCFGHIRALRERGVTLVFVSHDMSTVRDLCERALYLKQGRVAFAGDSRSAIRHYLAESAAGAGGNSTVCTGVSAPGFSGIPDDALWRRPADASPGPLLAVQILDSGGAAVTRARIGDTVRVRVFFNAAPSEAGHVSLVIKNRYDQVASSVGSFPAGMPALSSGNAAFAVYEAELDLMLEAGQYGMRVGFARPRGKNSGDLVDDTGWIGPFAIDWDYEHETAPFLGMFGVPLRGQLFHGPAAEAAAGDSHGGSR